MPESIPTQTLPMEVVAASPLMEKLLREKRAAREYQGRRHEDWDETYQLYRNKVFTNRLTQRQAVNIPLMKETIKTLLSKIDDPPSVDFKELGGDLEKEVILQEKWNDAYQSGNFEGVDLQDKKTVLLYGRGFKKLNFRDGRVEVDALDIYDVITDPMMNPLNVETARFIVHQNIFRSLREILADDRYTKEGRDKLKQWKMMPEGIIASEKNKEEWEKKMERLRAMGVDSDEFAHFAAGDVIVNLNEHFTLEWNKSKKEFERRVIVYADDAYELSNELLKDAIGVEFWPFVTWSEDVETSDTWSDSPADLVRVPNKVINVWFSQLVENRTLRNFGMHWYDSTVENYVPQTYDPGPGRMLPAPGEPNKTIMPVRLEGMEDTMNSIDFIIKLVERGTSAVAVEKGVSERKQITLGEVQMLVGKAMERTLSMAKFYRRSWEELAMKWYQLLEANETGKHTLYRRSSKGRIWPKEVYPYEWKSKKGFKAFARSTSEQEDEKTQSILRFSYLTGKYPDNRALRKIAQKRELEVVDLTPEEIREVQEEEKRTKELQDKTMALEAAAGQSPQPVQPAPQPQALRNLQPQKPSQKPLTQ